MKTSVFDSPYPISVLSFLSPFWAAGDHFETSIEALIWGSQYFRKEASAFALSRRLALEPSAFVRCIGDAHARSGSYVEVVNYLLAAYDAHNVTAGTVGDILRLSHAKEATAASFAKMLHKTVLHWRNVYPKIQFNFSAYLLKVSLSQSEKRFVPTEDWIPKWPYPI